jgi:DNA polymerase-3 subunit delta'
MSEEVNAAFLPWQSELLTQALELKKQNRLPHAVLIDSASNQDISAFVHYLSRLLLCDAPENLSTCDTCEACRMLRSGTYADFNFVTLEPNEKTNKLSKNIKIEQIRKLIHEVTLTSRYNRLKIATIYPAEAMNNSSANALLKTLEEPADGVLLLLVTHNKGRIPITLRSRSQVWNLKAADKVQAMDWLTEQDIDQEEAILHLDFANGDPILALSLKQQGYAALIDKFKSHFSRFIRGEMSVSVLCKELKGFESPLLRRLIDRILSAYCYQMSGANAGAEIASQHNQATTQALLQLQLQAQRNLQVEENNLDLQLQLEDVLISLKQILTRRTV